MAGIACTHVAMGWIGGVLYSRVARTRSYFRGPKGRLVYVGRGPAYVVWCGIPSWVIIASNRRCSSVMETQLSVHHRSLITGTRVRFEKEFDMKFMISLRIMADSYVVLIKFYMLKQRILLKSFYAKITLIIAKAIP